MTKENDELQVNGHSSKNEMSLSCECKEVKCKIEIIQPEPEKQTCLTSCENLTNFYQQELK